ncbi:hypothetical protein BN128_4212 [Cronobacter sakazakii 696]|nr:hypothetical protein BN128_4212 [Cronobacter sakazakii 696]
MQRFSPLRYAYETKRVSTLHPCKPVLLPEGSGCQNVLNAL